MAPFLLNLIPLSIRLTQSRSQNRRFRMRRWLGVLGLVLFAVVLGIIVKLWVEEKIGGRGREPRSGVVPPTPEPTKPATEADQLEPGAEPVVEPLAVSPDNLKRIRGIGPKIETLLKENGIVTFAQLAETEVSRLEALLVEAGWAKLADPTTWPEQARRLAEEK